MEGAPDATKAKGSEGGDTNDGKPDADATKAKPSEGDDTNDGKPDATGGRETEEAAPPMSKNQRKKMEKRLRVETHRKEKRMVLKERKREETESRRQEKKAEFESLPEEEKAARIERKRASIEAQRAEREAKRLRLDDASKSAVRVCFDLDFLDLMSEREKNSIKCQLGYAYASNTRAPCPLSMTFASYTESFRNALSIGEQHSGWRGVCFEPRGFVDAFHSAPAVGGGDEDVGRQAPALARPVPSLSDIVYLTADAEDELPSAGLDKSKVYVIGALVDRNRHKGACLDRARQAGVATARIPIDDEVASLLKGATVFTTNHVFDILLAVNAGMSWAEAVRHVQPTRKGGEGGGGGAEDEK